VAKSPNAFRTISEAAEAIGAPQHVLRFWETRFDFIEPVKRAGGRRFYRPRDIHLLKAVQRLLHDEGLTIRGVQRLYQDSGAKAFLAYGEGEADLCLEAAEHDSAATRSGAESLDGAGLRLTRLADEIDAARARLDAVLTA
jgi:DNA-binding transcriptional MerR regulator